MRLAEAGAEEVVQNAGNRSFYRMVRPEGNRARIRPLELFPNGLLIEKPTDTIVEADLEVRFVAIWTSDLVVAHQGEGRSRRAYERELAKLEAKLDGLLEEYRRLAPGQRGSHANKVKACQRRILVIRRGLEIREVNTDRPPLETTLAFRVRQAVQLPSGKPAVVLNAVGAGFQVAARGDNGILSLTIPSECLRPLIHRHLGTI